MLEMLFLANNTMAAISPATVPKSGSRDLAVQSTPTFRLPKLICPKSSGDQVGWQPFWDFCYSNPRLRGLTICNDYYMVKHPELRVELH